MRWNGFKVRLLQILLTLRDCKYMYNTNRKRRHKLKMCFIITHTIPKGVTDYNSLEIRNVIFHKLLTL